MDLWWYVYSALFGAIIGSFLNVVVYRMHTGRSVAGRSHCLSCGHGLRWFELIPVFSFLLLRGRCRACGARIPVHYALTELATAISFAFLWHWYGFDPVLFGLHAVYVSLLILIVRYDLRHLIIPSAAAYVAALIGACIVAYGAFSTGQLWQVLALHAASAAGAALFLGSFWLVSRGRWMGLGDAKLALALFVLLLPGAAVSAMVLAFWVGAAVSIAALAFAAVFRRAQSPRRPVAECSAWRTMKHEIPFAPFLVIGFVLAYFFHVDLLAFITSHPL